MTYAFDIHHSSEHGGEPVLDQVAFSALEELAGDDDPDLVAELVELFLEDSRERMQQIEDAIAGHDLEAIGSAAHALKSSSANIGARSFAKTCAEVESVSRSKEPVDPAAVESLVARALDMYREVCRVLDAEESRS